MEKPEQNVNLNITQIADAVKIIDFAAEQGVFKGWDAIKSVMKVRDSLALFVSAASQLTEPVQEQETNTPEEK